jgi:hypothetical protein
MRIYVLAVIMFQFAGFSIMAGQIRHTLGYECRPADAAYDRSQFQTA